ncbi:MAG: YdcF family protein, partial [Bacteroidetes bacterium]|nr:YdcF family protein [Bacteroidota bacterium]
NVIYSGAAVYTPYVEAEVMAIYAKALGIPEENIYTETRSEFSAENLYYSYRLARKSGFEKIAVATDPFQCRKLKKYRKKFGLPVDFIPVVFAILATIPQPNPDIDPSPAFKSDFIPVTKRYTFSGMRRGTTGKRILTGE